MKRTLETMAALSIILIPISAWAQSTSGPSEIAKRVTPAVVLIRGTTDAGEVIGSGFVLSPDGQIATNLHVIRDLKAGGIQLASGEIYDSFTVLAFDERKDIALIQIAGFDLPSTELGNSNEVQAGDSIVVIGSPRGLQGTLTVGVVSAIRDDPGGRGFRVVQIDAAVNPGNSGGPVLNQGGQVIGIATFGTKDSEGLNFAIPINYVRGLMANVQNPISLTQMRESLVDRKDIFSSSPFPTRWKSLHSGTTKVIRMSDDYLYVETVLPAESKARNDMMVAELKKQGDKYVGRIRAVATCSYPHAWWGWNQPQYNRCSEEMGIEITRLTSTRIEGKVEDYPAGTKYDCKKCSYEKNKKRAWMEFAWIPE